MSNKRRSDIYDRQEYIDVGSYRVVGEMWYKNKSIMLKEVGGVNNATQTH